MGRLTDEQFFNQLQDEGILLHENQIRAVRHVHGPLAVFAGPGSGKTTVLTCRTLYQMQVGGIPARDMMVVTFTRAAAREMKERLEKLLGDEHMKLRAVEMGTFHSVFLKILMRARGAVPTLVTNREQRQFAARALTEDGEESADEQVTDLLTKIGLCKNGLILPEQIRAEKDTNRLFAQRYARYETLKSEANVWDYDDILIQCYQMLVQDPQILQVCQQRYRYLLVDEFQDVNKVQYEILRLLGAHGNLCVVGDDDQSIYQFRGAKAEYLLRFQDDFPKAETVVLGKNYRSTDSIIALSEKLILHNQTRQSKPFSGTDRAGKEIKLVQPHDEREEALQVLQQIEQWTLEGVPAEQIAVLFRTHQQARAIVDALVEQKKPFLLHDGEHHFYRGWQVRDMIAYVKVALDAWDLDSLVQVVNRPKRYLYKRGWVDELHHVSGINELNYVQALTKISDLEPYQTKKLQEMMTQLQQVAKRKPDQAIRYIRTVIGYDKYLEEYTKQTGNDYNTVIEPLDELQEATAPFETLEDWLLHLEDVERAIRESRQKGEGIQLMTLHKSKGLEFTAVSLIGLVNGIMPHQKSLGQDQESNPDKKLEAMEEERRLAYVGITRAKNFLLIASPEQYRKKKNTPSPFLLEMGLLRPEAAKKQKAILQQESTVSKMQNALASYGKEAYSVGDCLHHKEMGEGTIKEIIPLVGTEGRRITFIIKNTGRQLDLHLELCLQMGILRAG